MYDILDTHCLSTPYSSPDRDFSVGSFCKKNKKNEKKPIDI